MKLLLRLNKTGFCRQSLLSFVLTTMRELKIEAPMSETRYITIRRNSLVLSKSVPLRLVSFLTATFALLFSVAPSRAQTTAMTIES